MRPRGPVFARLRRGGFGPYGFRPPEPPAALKLEGQPPRHPNQLLFPIAVVENDPKRSVIGEDTVDLVERISKSVDIAFGGTFLADLAGMAIIALSPVRW